MKLRVVIKLYQKQAFESIPETNNQSGGRNKFVIAWRDRQTI